ncbi:MAG: hypothetical protein ACRDTR_04250 [Rubrobacter sp.]
MGQAGVSPFTVPPKPYVMPGEYNPFGVKPKAEFDKAVEEIRKRVSQPPPTDPGIAEEAGLWERKRRRGGSYLSSFLTGQSASSTYLTDLMGPGPNTLMGGR